MARFDTERWRTLSPLLDTAMGLDDAARKVWLEDLEAQDDGLAEEVRSWLDRQRELQASAFLEDAGPDRWMFRLRAGATLGNYRLLDCIGEGGMGNVWRAARADGLYQDQVAVKVLSANRIHHVGRFARERQLLARLRHPNIASLLDAGITDGGVPFLVLELVEGLPIDAYCDERRLPLEDRVRLFLLVLDGVAAAHRQLIVHRDLKPSNIMVSNVGEVKLLDFGIAKILEEASKDADQEANLTLDLGQLLTPAYAAPEQLTGGSVSTATDTYALGMLLANLLCGCLLREPHTGDPVSAAVADGNDPPRMSLRYRDQDASVRAQVAGHRATRPEQLDKQLRGDLDFVVAKATRTEPEQRYATVAEFRDDLVRYLLHEPVIARQGSSWYRISKFARRNRRTLAVASVSVLLLSGTLAMVAWQRAQSAQQLQIAEFEAQRAEASEQFMMLILEVVGPGGKHLTPMELLDEVISALEIRYAHDPRFTSRMLSELSRRYMDLGANERAHEVLQRALTIARAEGDAESIAAANCALVRVLPRVGLQERQDVVLQQALSVLRELPAVSLRIRVNCLRAEAEALQARGLSDRSLVVLAEARALLQDTDAPDSGWLTGVLTQQGGIHLAEGRLREAYEANMEASRVFAATGRGNTLGAAIALENTSTLLGLMGEIVASDRIMQQSLRRRFEARPNGLPNALTLINNATNAIRLDRLDDAQRFLDDAFKQAQEQGDALSQALVQGSMAQLRIEQGRADDAHRWLTLAEDFILNQSERFERIKIRMRILRARVRYVSGASESALQDVDKLVDKYGSADPRLLPVLHLGARILLEQGQFTRALELSQSAVATSTTLARDPEQSADVGASYLIVGETLAAMARMEEAYAAFQRAALSLGNGLGAQHRLAVVAADRAAAMNQQPDS